MAAGTSSDHDPVGRSSLAELRAGSSRPRSVRSTASWVTERYAGFHIPDGCTAGLPGRDGIEKCLFSPGLEQLPRFDEGGGVDRPEPFLDLLERVPRPLTVEAITEAVVDREDRPRGRSHRTRRVEGTLQRTRHDRAQRHSAKYLAERGGLGFTGGVQRDVELSSEHASGIESRLSVSNEEDVHGYHA